MMEPQTVVPAMPEITLTGMKAQLMPRILQCSRGGYVVIFDGHGVSATSSFKEAIDKIMEVGAQVLQEEYEPDLPRIAREELFKEPPPIPASEKVNLGRVLHVGVATIATCLIAIGIKIT